MTFETIVVRILSDYLPCNNCGAWNRFGRARIEILMREIVIASRRIFFKDIQPSLKPPQAALVLIHGAGGSHLTWRRQFDALSERFRVIALDLPGHGLSEGSGETAIGKYAEYVLELLESLGLSRVVLGGHSMGGAIALEIALSHPEKLGGLVLVGTGAKLRVLPAIFSVLKEDFNLAIENMAQFTFGPEAPEELLDEEKQLLAGNSSDLLVKDFTACDRFDVMGRVESIDLPALIICGTEDRLTPRKYSEYLHQRIANSELALFEGCGHMPMLEQSNKFNDCVSSFLTGR